MKQTEGVYFLAEAGQNHNGSIELAHRLIELAAMPIYHEGKQLPGVDAVKFVKRDMDHEMTAAEWNRPYDSPHSFGKTYGEHRTALELTPEQHAELFIDAKAHNLDFIETVCSVEALRLILELFQPDAIKIASRDADNIPLLRAISDCGLPVIISTGMSSLIRISVSVGQLVEPRARGELSILHCVSQYPASYDAIQLGSIARLKETFPDCPIGYSDHTTGILAPAIAVSQGAQLIEKHITLDRGMKGSDHAGSLGPEGLQRCVRDVRDTERALGSTKWLNKPESAAKSVSIGRSVASRRFIQKGKKIGPEDIEMLSPGTGIDGTQYETVCCKTAAVDIEAKTLIGWEMLE